MTAQSVQPTAAATTSTAARVVTSTKEDATCGPSPFSAATASAGAKDDHGSTSPASIKTVTTSPESALPPNAAEVPPTPSSVLFDTRSGLKAAVAAAAAAGVSSPASTTTAAAHTDIPDEQSPSSDAVSDIPPNADTGADAAADGATEDASLAEEEQAVAETHVVNSDDNTQFTLQLVPFSDIPGRAPLGETMERKFKEGTSIRIGRQVIRDGVAVGKSKDGDVWFTSKVVSRIHCEMWCRDGTLYIKDIGSSSGTFLNKMRLSPSGKASRPYPLKQGDLLQFGIDYKGKSDDVYKSITVKIAFSSKPENRHKPSNTSKFRSALQSLLAATNPFASNDQPSESMVDCCICIGAIGPYQALFVAPCSHCYHYKCVHTLLVQSLMFQCPMCRQVANLTASVSMESLSGEETLCRGGEHLISQS